MQQTVGARTRFDVRSAYRPTSPPIGTKRPKPAAARSVTRFRKRTFFNTRLTGDHPLCGAGDRDKIRLKFTPQLIEARCIAHGSEPSSPSLVRFGIGKPLVLATRSASHSAHQIDSGARLEERIG